MITAKRSARSANSAPLFDIICAMEDDLSAIQNFANALAFISETMEEQVGAVVQRVAWEVLDRAEALAKHRGELFRALHPARAHFERAGWPDDAQLADQAVT